MKFKFCPKCKRPFHGHKDFCPNCKPTKRIKQRRAPRARR